MVNNKYIKYIGQELMKELTKYINNEQFDNKKLESLKHKDIEFKKLKTTGFINYESFKHYDKLKRFEIKKLNTLYGSLSSLIA